MENTKEKVHVCDFCGWEGTVSEMKHISGDVYDQHDCPSCGWVMINNLQ